LIRAGLRELESFTQLDRWFDRAIAAGTAAKVFAD